MTDWEQFRTDAMGFGAGVLVAPFPTDDDAEIDAVVTTSAPVEGERSLDWLYRAIGCQLVQVVQVDTPQGPVDIWMDEEPSDEAPVNMVASGLFGQMIRGNVVICPTSGDGETRGFIERQASEFAERCQGAVAESREIYRQMQRMAGFVLVRDESGEWHPLLLGLDGLDAGEGDES